MKYHGKIGYADQVETAPGVFEDLITERPYIGDVKQRTEVLTLGDTVIPQYSTRTSVSVLSDGVLKVNYSNIRYVEYSGVKWTISSAVVEWPRLTLYIGEEYHGPIPDGFA